MSEFKRGPVVLQAWRNLPGPTPGWLQKVGGQGIAGGILIVNSPPSGCISVQPGEWVVIYTNGAVVAMSDATFRAQHMGALREPRSFASRAADALADEVAVLVRRGKIDARSPAADALVDYRNPPFSDRSERIGQLVATVEHYEQHLSAIMGQCLGSARSAARELLAAVLLQVGQRAQAALRYSSAVGPLCRECGRGCDLDGYCDPCARAAVKAAGGEDAVIMDLLTGQASPTHVRCTHCGHVAGTVPVPKYCPKGPQDGDDKPSHNYVAVRPDAEPSR